MSDSNGIWSIVSEIRILHDLLGHLLKEVLELHLAGEEFLLGFPHTLLRELDGRGELDISVAELCQIVLMDVYICGNGSAIFHLISNLRR